MRSDWEGISVWRLDILVFALRSVLEGLALAFLFCDYTTLLYCMLDCCSQLFLAFPEIYITSHCCICAG